VQQLQDPADGDILGEQGQLGEGQDQHVMELIDEAGALANNGLEPAGDLAKDAQL
jgi:hypothetical protein